MNFPYGHLKGLRQLAGSTVDLTDDERATREALRDEYDRLEAEYAEAEELLDDIDQRLGEVDAALEAFDSLPMVYAPGQMAKAGFEIKGHCHPASIRPEQSSPSRLSSVPLAPTSPQATQYNGTMRKPQGQRNGGSPHLGDRPLAEPLTESDRRAKNLMGARRPTKALQSDEGGGLGGLPRRQTAALERSVHSLRAAALAQWPPDGSRWTS